MTQKQKSPQAQSKAQFPVVGIGASAGGLEAFEAFFKAMPEKPGAAFILVAHLDPGNVSILPELIQKKTNMKVQQVQDNMEVMSNQVYVIPPNRHMAIINGSLQLLELAQPRSKNLPINIFFQSLGKDQERNAIGIILSGTGTDGTLGIKEIKSEGGMVMVQDPESAKYDGMPQSAIATEFADYVLPPSHMPDKLLNYIRRLPKSSAGEISVEDENLRNAIQKIILVLRTQTGHDFSQYKMNTIYRRIERRMSVHQFTDFSAYVRYILGAEKEVWILFRELLIGVTSFFRDPKAFELLKSTVLPDLLQNKPDEYQIRVFGCLAAAVGKRPIL